MISHRFVIWIICMMTLHTANGDSDEMMCADGWEKVHRSCMRFENRSEDFKTWQEAQAQCDSEGAQLMSISDASEMDKLTQTLKKYVQNRATGELYLNWWVGLSYVYSEETGKDGWMWLDGAYFDPDLVLWAPGEPSNAKTEESEDCGILNYQKFIKDGNCSEQLPFICEEIKLTPPTTISTSFTTATTEGVNSKPSKGPVTTNVTQSTLGWSATPTLSSSIPRTTDATAPITTSTVSVTNSHTGTTLNDKTKKPKTKSPNKPTQPPSSNKPSDDAFAGCYAVNCEVFCPAVTALGISWPQTQAGHTAVVQCETGKVRWTCDTEPVCWRGEPNVKPCTSQAIQNLSDQATSVLAEPEDTDQVIYFTNHLAESASRPETLLTEQDIYQSTKLMGVAANTKPQNASAAKLIIKNIVKCGSSLMSREKKSTWSTMSIENKRSIASSLISSVETVSRKMLNTFVTPTVETIRQRNMEVVLHVIDTVTLDSPMAKDLVFASRDDGFSIPPENLMRASKGGLVRVVFISYDDVGPLLAPTADGGSDRMDRRVISKVISASLGNSHAETNNLTQPVTVTFKTEHRGTQPDWKQQCSFWNFSLGYKGAWSDEGCSLYRYNNTHTTCQCDHMTNFAILMDIHKTKVPSVHASTLSYITYVGIIISIICLFLSFVTFVCLSIRCMRPSRDSSEPRGYDLYGDSNSGGSLSAHERTVQGERNSIHKNLVVCLFVAEVLFLAGIERIDTKIGCSLIAGFLHFFFLASFTWMFVEGIHILFMLVQVFDAARSRLKYYYIVGYGAPVIIVGVSALIFHEGYGTDKYCWLTNDRMFIWSFAGPVAFILLVNLMILIYAMSAVCKHSEYVFSREKSSASNLKGWIQGALALEVLLGLTWLFGYFYISEEAIPMAYLFTICNSLQGLFIFIFHCLMNKKVRKEYERFIDYRRPVSSSTQSSKSTGSNGVNAAGSYALNSSRKQSTFTDLGKSRNGSYSA